jgi:hypothetical protein
MQLSTDSALQMTRTIGLQSQRERDLIMSFAVHILHRVLPEAMESLKVSERVIRGEAYQALI